MKLQNLMATAVVGLTFVAGVVSNAVAQLTNVIPENVFLTDDGHVFWYKPGKRFVDTKKIREALDLPESRPADQDPDGHWGMPTNGFQLSLRFNKLVFTNNEPVVATLLLRNATNSPVKFLRASITHQPSPINVLAFRGKMPLSRKSFSGPIDVISANEITIYPQTQCKYAVRLNDYYDLSGSGEYVFQAAYEQGGVTSQYVAITITN